MSDNPFFDASVELGQELFKAKKEAEKVGERGTPFGKRRVEPAEFRREMDAASPEMRKGTLDRLTKEMGGNRYAATKEMLRMMGLKPPPMPGGQP